MYNSLCAQTSKGLSDIFVNRPPKINDIPFSGIPHHTQRSASNIGIVTSNRQSLATISVLIGCPRKLKVGNFRKILGRIVFNHY